MKIIKKIMALPPVELVGLGLLLVCGHTLLYFVCGFFAMGMGADFHHWMLSWHPWLALFVASMWGLIIGALIVGGHRDNAK